ncbi:MAG: nitrite reductase [Magnetospirillum sp. WYHS-4]
MRHWSHPLVLAAALMAPAPGEAADSGEEPRLAPAEFEAARMHYFQHCAGCHGVLRRGATGRSLEPVAARKLGQEKLERIIAQGTDGGMNGFDDTFTKDEIARLATYVRMPVPVPPEMSLADMKKTRRELVRPEDAPKAPQHGRNWKNFFVTILRDAGKVAILDGDRKDVVAEIDTGYAVHVAEGTSDGRYWFSIGRDGRLTKMDLWSDPPRIMAEVQVAYDARGIAVARFGTQKDRYLVAGGFWPPHFVIVDTETLEPLKVVSTSGMDVEGRFVREARVAALAASPAGPTWMVAVKELGQVWQVDYSDLRNLRIEMIDSARFLHDGFFDPTERFFQVAANASNAMVFVDSQTRKLVGQLETGRKPHPGPGANWIDAQCGPVGATVHMGQGRISVWGNDPKGHPEMAWKLCYSLPLEGPGLFLRGHPNSPHVFADQALHPDVEVASGIKVLDTRRRQVVETLKVTAHPKGVALHPEFNHDGSEVWISVWAKGRKAERQKGEVVVYDSATLKEKARIGGLETPTGKFNVSGRVTK